MKKKIKGSFMRVSYSLRDELGKLKLPIKRMRWQTSIESYGDVIMRLIKKHKKAMMQEKKRLLK